VLTVLKREKPRRQDAAAQVEEMADETQEVLPPDLAKLEDTVFRDTSGQSDAPPEESGESDDSPA
jgi:hypothetical protein